MPNTTKTKNTVHNKSKPKIKSNNKIVKIRHMVQINNSNSN